MHQALEPNEMINNYQQQLQQQLGNRQHYSTPQSYEHQNQLETYQSMSPPPNDQIQSSSTLQQPTTNTIQAARDNLNNYPQQLPQKIADNEQQFAAPQSYEPQNLQESYQSMSPPPNDQMQSSTLQQPTENTIQMVQYANLNNALRLRGSPHQMHSQHDAWLDHPNEMYNYLNHQQQQQQQQTDNLQKFTAPQSYGPQNQKNSQSMSLPPNDQMQPSNVLQQPIADTANPNLTFQNQPRAPQSPTNESNANSGFLQFPNILKSFSNLITNDPPASPAENPQFSQNQAPQLNQQQSSPTNSLSQPQVQQSNKPPGTTDSLQSSSAPQNQQTQQPQSFSPSQSVDKNQLSSKTDPPAPALRTSVSQTGASPAEFSSNTLPQTQIQSSQSNLPNAQLDESPKINQSSSFNKGSPAKQNQPPPTEPSKPSSFLQQTGESSSTKTQNLSYPLSQNIQAQSPQSSSKTENIKKEQNQTLPPTAEIQSPITNQQPTINQPPSKIPSILSQLLETNPPVKNQLNTPTQPSVQPSQTQFTPTSLLAQQTQVQPNPQSKSSAQNVESYSPEVPKIYNTPVKTYDRQGLEVHTPASHLQNDLAPTINNIPQSSSNVLKAQDNAFNNLSPNPQNNLNPSKSVSVPGSTQSDSLNSSTSNDRLKGVSPEATTVNGNSNSKTTTVNNSPPPPVEPEAKENKAAFTSMENKEFDAPANFNGLAMYDSTYNVNTEDVENVKDDASKLRVHADPSDIHILNLPPVRTAAPDESPNSSAAFSNSWSYNSRPNINVQTSTAAGPQQSINTNNKYSQQQYALNDNGKNRIAVLDANDDRSTADSSDGYTYKQFDFSNPPLHPTSWSLPNHDEPGAKKPTGGASNQNYNYNPQRAALLQRPFDSGRNPISSGADVVGVQPTDSSSSSNNIYAKVDLNNPPVYPMSWSLPNNDDPARSPTAAAFNYNYPQRVAPLLPPFDSGRNPIADSGSVNQPAIDSSGYLYKPVDLGNIPAYPTSWSLPNRDSGRLQNQNDVNPKPPGYPPNSVQGGYYPQTTANYGLGRTPLPPPLFNQDYNLPTIPISRGPVPPAAPLPNSFVQNTMALISNAFQTPPYGTRAVFDVTQSNFPDMPESQQINLTYVVVQAITQGLRKILDEFIRSLIFVSIGRASRAL